MSLVTDILLLFASSGALFYCLILNRRLRALQSTNNGLGAAIASLTRSVRETKASLSETTSMADEVVERIQPLIEDAKSASENLEGLIERQVETGDKVMAATEKAGSDLMDRLAPLIDQAHDIADALERHNKAHGAKRTGAKPAKPVKEDLADAMAAEPAPAPIVEPQAEDVGEPAPEAVAEEEEEDSRFRLARLKR
ncbi:MAG: DUF6468 domain-containing protein [Pseudomonadota bacterium]